MNKNETRRRLANIGLLVPIAPAHVKNRVPPHIALIGAPRSLRGRISKTPDHEPTKLQPVGERDLEAIARAENKRARRAARNKA